MARYRAALIGCGGNTGMREASVQDIKHSQEVNLINTKQQLSLLLKNI